MKYGDESKAKQSKGKGKKRNLLYKGSPSLFFSCATILLDDVMYSDQIVMSKLQCSLASMVGGCARSLSHFCL